MNNIPQKRKAHFLDVESQHVNLALLLPKKIIAILPRKRMFQLCGLFVVILIILYGIAFWNNSRLSNQIAQIKQEEQKLAAQFLTLGKQYPELSRGDPIAKLAEEVKNKSEVIAVFKKATQINVTGFSKFLEELAEYKKGRTAWLSRIHILENGEDIELTGFAVSTDAGLKLVENLNKMPLLKNDRFYLVSLNKTGKKGLFQLELRTKQGSENES